MQGINSLLLLRHRSKALLFAAFIATYILQTVLPAPDKAALTHYHLTTASAKVLGLTVIIPYIAIWVIALLGYLRLRTYSDTIARSKDGFAFHTISQGLWLLVLWPPLSALASGFSVEYYTAHPSATAMLTRWNNYFNLILLFIAFWLLYKGSTKLIRLVKTPDYRYYQPTVLLFIAFSVLYTFLTLHDTVRNHASGSTLSTYYSSDWIIILTLIIPRLISWYLGLLAVQNILAYRRRVKGILYQKALQRLAIGLGGVILSVIVLRMVQSLAAPIGKLGLGLLLILIFGLLAVIAVGYTLTAQGAKKLQKIEEL